MNKFNSSEITKEIGLIEIFKSSIFRLPISKINVYSTFFVFSILLYYVIVSPENSTYLLIKIRKWTELGFSFSAGILGFLIAGFTIFATVSDKSLFVTMAKSLHSGTQLSYLKYNFFSLMYVFILYLGFAILCLLVQILGGESGFLSIILNQLSGSNFVSVKRFIAGFGIIFVGTWFFYLLMLLQSFIFNIYHIVMTAIRWEVENQHFTLLIIDSYRFFCYLGDQDETPHVYVERNQGEAKFGLDPVCIKDRGSFGHRELNRIQRLIEEHQENLLVVWYQSFGN